MRYDPTEVLKARKVELVCRWVATISTLGTTAPAGSVIKPVMAPRSPCANAGEARHRSAIDTAASKNRLILIISFAGTTETAHGERSEIRWERTHPSRSEEHTSELQSLRHLVCRLLLEKK